MYNNTSKMRNIDLPENLFSNLGQINHQQNPKDTLGFQPMEYRDVESKRKNEYNFLKNDYVPITEYQPTLKKYTIPKKKENILDSNFVNEANLKKLSNKKEYRTRMDNMYNEVKNLKPIDNEIDDVIYFNNYTEKGIVVKPKVSSLKQFWTEYRLIKNEKNTKKTEKSTLTNFDELFNQLSERVEEINLYIDELKEMRTSIDISSTKLEEEKFKLKEEKQEFIYYKKAEEDKIKAEKESLKINYDRLQTIINDLDKKLTEIDT